MARRHRPEPAPIETHEQALVRRAFRARRQGDERKAFVSLREAALSNEHDARLWVHYGVQCRRVGQLDSARRALSHAAWLRDRSGETKKARVIRRVLGTLGEPWAA